MKETSSEELKKITQLLSVNCYEEVTRMPIKKQKSYFKKL